MAGTEWEVIFVDDDSTDGTANVVREISRTNPRVRCVHRIGRRGGLSSACVEGVLASSAPYVAVMDADLQHDESILPAMLRVAKEEDVNRCAPWRAKRGRVVPGRRRRGRMAVVAWGR
jgi:dolichol-phosphate mannosyltransferase